MSEQDSIEKITKLLRDLASDIAVAGINGFGNQVNMLADRLDALVPALEAEEKDAERYRWLRECSMHRSDGMIHITLSLYKNGVYEGQKFTAYDELDWLVDRAIKGEQS